MQLVAMVTAYLVLTPECEDIPCVHLFSSYKLLPSYTVRHVQELSLVYRYWSHYVRLASILIKNMRYLIM